MGEFLDIAVAVAIDPVEFAKTYVKVMTLYHLSFSQHTKHFDTFNELA